MFIFRLIVYLICSDVQVRLFAYEQLAPVSDTLISEVFFVFVCQIGRTDVGTLETFCRNQTLEMHAEARNVRHSTSMEVGINKS